MRQSALLNLWTKVLRKTISHRPGGLRMQAKRRTTVVQARHQHTGNASKVIEHLDVRARETATHFLHEGVLLADSELEANRTFGFQIGRRLLQERPDGVETILTAH